MWTSSYLPSRTKLLVLGGLALLLATSVGLLLLLRSCPHKRPAAPSAADGVTVRLHIGGTPGACLRLDGQVVGPLPVELKLDLPRPRRVMLHACRGGHLDTGTEVLLRPGDEVSQDLWLPRYRLLQAGEAPAPFSYRHPCPCEAPEPAPRARLHHCSH